MPELAEAFSVSAETVRRDLVYLESKGKLRRVFGGAVKDESRRFNDYSKRMIENADKKAELCQIAVGLVEEGDILAIDGGSTATVLVGILRETFKKLTIITACMDVFDDSRIPFPSFYRAGSIKKRSIRFTAIWR